MFKLDRHVKPPKVEHKTEWQQMPEFERGRIAGATIKASRDPATVQEFLYKAQHNMGEYDRGFFVGLGGDLSTLEMSPEFAGFVRAIMRPVRQGKTNTVRILTETEKANVTWKNVDKNANWRGK